MTHAETGGLRDRAAFPVVGVYHDEPAEYLPLLEALIPAERLRVCTRWDGLHEILPELDALLAFRFRNRPFPRDAILAAPRLKWVQLSSAGVDHIVPFDSTALTVTNTSGLHADSVALYVLTAVTHLLWDMPRLRRQQLEHRWQRRSLPSLVGRTIGVIGAGHIGRRIGLAAKAVGMVPIGVRRGGRAVVGFERVLGPEGLEELLSRSDVVVVSLPLTAETRGLLDDRRLRALRRSAYLVNVSRGGIVDEAALHRVLQQGGIAGAVLDVFEREPLPHSSPLWDLPNVLITPHVAGEFERWPSAVAAFFCENLRRWTAGDPLVNVIESIKGY